VIGEHKIEMTFVPAPSDASQLTEQRMAVAGLVAAEVVPVLVLGPRRVNRGFASGTLNSRLTRKR
jgi:hypothetical protein